MSGSLAGYSIIINGHEMGSWKAMFYVFGCIGLLWSPLWVVSVSERPQECVGISSQELDLLVKGEFSYLSFFYYMLAFLF